MDRGLTDGMVGTTQQLWTKSCSGIFLDFQILNVGSVAMVFHIEVDIAQPLCTLGSSSMKHWNNHVLHSEDSILRALE